MPMWTGLAFGQSDRCSSARQQARGGGAFPSLHTIPMLPPLSNPMLARVGQSTVGGRCILQRHPLLCPPAFSRACCSASLCFHPTPCLGESATCWERSEGYQITSQPGSDMLRLEKGGAGGSFYSIRLAKDGQWVSGGSTLPCHALASTSESKMRQW